MFSTSYAVYVQYKLLKTVQKKVKSRAINYTWIKSNYNKNILDYLN